MSSLSSAILSALQRSMHTPCRRLACTCVGGERVSAMSPLYPNPWRKKCWGPFTAFRVDRGPSSDDNAGLPMGIFR
eukprot:1480656-Pleurochrysis_carterae.AAC.1